MPYTEMGHRKETRADWDKANSDGDYNYLFTVAYLEAFKDEPSYGTIALIRKASIDPARIDGVRKLDEYLEKEGIEPLTRCVARELAFAEFYRRIGVKYEKECIVKNGDLPEYEEAERIIQKKFRFEKD